MPKQPCRRPGCGRLVDRGYCDACRPSSPAVVQEKQRGSSTQRGYGYKWQKYSAGFLRRHPVCEGMRLRRDGPVEVNTHPGRVVASEHTDHIEAVNGADDPLFWDEGNHQPGCAACHSRKTVLEDGGFRGKVRGMRVMG